MTKRIFLACTLGLVHIAYGATTGTWNITGSGAWDVSGNWTPGPFPNGIGDTANFSNSITGNSTITSGSGITVGNMTFDDDNNYLVSLSGNTLTMNNGGTANITVTTVNGSGSHSISAPVLLANSLLINHTSSASFTMSGAISQSGSRSLTKAGAGTGALVLTGSNTFGGGVEINAGILEVSSNGNLGTAGSPLSFTGTNGTLRTTASFTIPAAKSITLPSTSGTFETNPGVTTTIDGDISFGLNLVKTGTGTLVLTNLGNAYGPGGATIITAGTLSVGADANLGFPTEGITFDGGTLRTTASFTIPVARAISITGAAAIFEPTAGATTTTIAGVIPGAGKALTKIGAGTLVLANAANTYSGGTNINAGTLSISVDANLGNVAGGITFDGGTLETTASFTIVSTRAISIPSAGTFQVDPSFTTTVAGPITGIGSLTKTNTGTLTLTNGLNSYSGGTTINDGTLSLSGSGILAAGGSVNVNNATSIFDISAITAGGLTIGDLSGVASSSVMLGLKALTFGSTGTATFAGSISDTAGSGSVVKQGSGTAIFSGVNTYAGGTTINAGILSITTDANLGAATGGITFGGGTLQTPASFTIPVTRPISITGGTAIFEPTPAATTTTMAAVIPGALKALTKIGPGKLILTAANTYGGGTFINAGTLEISANGNLGAAAGGITFGGGTLRTTAPFAIPIARAISITSAATFEPVAVTTTVDGVISGIGGTLTKTGTGVLELTNSNTYTGGTTINAATLSLSGSGALDSTSAVNVNSATSIFDISAITPAGTSIGDLSSAFATSSVALGLKALTLGSTGIATFAGSISDTAGSGSVVKQGSGIAMFSGSNTYGSGTTINNGILSLLGSGTLLSTGAVSVNSATSIFDISATSTGATIGDLSGVASSSVTLGSKELTLGTATVSTTFAGGISGSGGAIVKQGSGAVVLSGVNTFTGGTTINDGTVSLSGSGALAPTGAVSVNSATAVFDVSSITAATTIGDLSGVSGSSVTLGAKTLTFGTAVSTTVAGNISGTASLVKQGTGRFTVSGANTFIGTFDVNAGELNMASTGSLPFASTTNIASGTTLTGTGTLGAVNLSGTVSPGNSIGTLNVGDITFNASSTFIVELSNTTSDKIISSGVVTINPGATLSLMGSGLTLPTSSYLVIDSSAPLVRNGDFTLVNPFTRFNFVIHYEPQDVLVLFLASVTNFFGTGNAAGVAACFNTLLNNPPPDLIPVIDVLNVQTMAQWQDSFNQMQPSNFDDIAYAEENVAERIAQNFSAHLFEQRVKSCPSELPWRLWFAPFVEHVHQSGKGEHSGYKENFRGFTAAADYQAKQHWTLTTGFSYVDSDVGIISGKASGRFKTYAGSVGIIWKNSNFFTDGLLSYLYSWVHAKRAMHFKVDPQPLFFSVDPVSRTANHQQGSNQVMGHFGFGWNFKFTDKYHGTLNFYPFANIDYIYVMQHGYKEKGAQSLDLTVSSKNYDLLRPEGGIGLCYAGCFEKVQVTADLSASYIREQRFFGKKTKAHFKDSSCSFTVKGLNPINNLISPTARLTITSLRAAPISISVGYHGEFGSNFIENAGDAELKVSF